MRSLGDDRTARAVIRDESLRLFAAYGPDAVTIRQVAHAAGVSAGLVVHHFGSRDGLRQAVDEYVLAVFDDLFSTMPELDWTVRSATGSLTEVVLARLPVDSPIPAYLSRLLLSGDPTGTRLFTRWMQAGQQAIDRLETTGVLRPSQDPAVRAAFLMANDLALLLLRDRLTAHLGVDPLSREGITRWSEEVMTIYRSGLFADPSGPVAKPTP